ncbi:3'-5' exonuclease [Pediococcus claussenii]|uniref:DNA polymerase III polC-type n=1 Tax=Pediococcus claussenii (strain ATCC BAA-344 / DSM 14800 / JCM 18046 / KCTC 3811 / LMG 21948 / P06) TaxID=701521 RepID=G8PC48_PEDCP|nr:3'-5' exonuclease [Pediococcus claussenii]AEV94867.1 exonuclease, DNA polymerase III, epsilon subunit family protein [Pediococcus claussenii ATCC BAA-344]ANZ70063.1 exonuclease [Pediococcus claussenii]ANZ71878.1 exonuclease [Pediococcus claussenii]
MNFIAMDFETAAPNRDSACSIALTIIQNNQITDELYSLINPEVEFNWRNIQVHGIHEEDVVDAPTFPELWPYISEFFTPDQIVVAHNASFDNSVLKKTLERYQIGRLPYLSIDTLKTSKQFYPFLPNHKLNTLCSSLGIELDHHHNALDDSKACANILLKETEEFGPESIQPFVRNIS